MLCMARCSSQSTVLTSWVSHWPQRPPGRHINITNKASRTLGSGKNPEDRLLFSKRQGLQAQGSCHTSPGICKLYLAPKQHQADQPPRVCTVKGSMVDTTEMLQDIQCQQHADNARLTISPTQVQESKTSEYHVTIPVSQEPIIPVPCYTQCPPVKRCTDYRKFSFFPNAIKDWNDLSEDVAAAPTLETFCSRLPKSVPSE